MQDFSSDSEPTYGLSYVITIYIYISFFGPALDCDSIEHLGSKLLSSSNDHQFTSGLNGYILDWLTMHVWWKPLDLLVIIEATRWRPLQQCNNIAGVRTATRALRLDLLPNRGRWAQWKRCCASLSRPNFTGCVPILRGDHARRAVQRHFAEQGEHQCLPH